MKFENKAQLLNLLYNLQSELLQEAETTQTEIDETIDEAIKTLICYLD